tara:strand:+ start:314 stop:1072 length:759 start_codon:yes stop_codon:yes gene_type:complete
MRYKKQRIRRDREALVRNRYTLSSLYDGSDAHKCAYCGVYPDTADHVLPIVFMEFLILNGDKNTRSEIVPACNECNALAGSRVFSSFKKKKEYVQSKIFSRYSRIAEWTEEEIEESELRGNLKDIVVGDMKRREYHIARWNYENIRYTGESHKPIEEGHLKDLIIDSFQYEEEANKEVKRVKQRLKNPSSYITSIKAAAEYCNITTNELQKHVKHGNIDYVRDDRNRYAFKKNHLNDFIHDIEILREDMSYS